jgi:hypothetical protein
VSKDSKEKIFAGEQVFWSKEHRDQSQNSLSDKQLADRLKPPGGEMNELLDQARTSAPANESKGQPSANIRADSSDKSAPSVRSRMVKWGKSTHFLSHENFRRVRGSLNITGRQET